jgi:hypothetical protein
MTGIGMLAREASVALLAKGGPEAAPHAVSGAGRQAVSFGAARFSIYLASRMASEPKLI